MANSTLRLTIDKGPKAGETLACKPGTVIGIGRVVRGNTFAIKDPGISQKHLTVCFLHEITRWVVTDLGSSNGTYINGFLISPDEPYSLSDGDSIKIGEKTSISVNISAPVDQTSVLPACDRPRRPQNEVKLEDKACEENVDEPSNNGEKVRGRGRKGGRSTRSSRNDKVLEPVLVEPRVTRSLARRGSLRAFVKKVKEEDVMIFSNSEFVDVIEKEEKSKEKNAVVEEEVVALDGENNSRVDEVKHSMDATSKENSARVEEEVVAVDGESNCSMDATSKENSARVEGELLDRVGENNSTVEEVEDNMNNISKKSNAGVEEEVLIVDGKHNSRVEQVEDNMYNMTLGEWFDRMEEYLPKSINKVAEEIIDKLREKARFFDEYVTQTSDVLVE